MTTPLDLPELRALERLVTPGPWRVYVQPSEDRGDAFGVSAPSPHHWAIPPLGIPESTAAFIASARAALPAALDEIEALRATAVDHRVRLEEERTLRLRAESALTEAREALRVIDAAARTDHKHQFNDLREWLDARGIFNGDVDGGDGCDLIAMVTDRLLSSTEKGGGK